MFYQIIDNPLVVVALAAFFIVADIDQRIVKVRTERHIGDRHCTADQHFVPVRGTEIRLPVVFIAFTIDGAPGLFIGDLPHTVQNVVADKGTAIRHTLSGPFRGQFLNCFWIVKEHMQLLSEIICSNAVSFIRETLIQAFP